MVKRWYENKVSGMMKGQALFLMRTRPMPGTRIVIGWRSSDKKQRTDSLLTEEINYISVRALDHPRSRIFKRLHQHSSMQQVCSTLPTDQ